jgi:hypothetical protein
LGCASRKRRLALPKRTPFCERLVGTIRQSASTS